MLVELEAELEVELALGRGWAETERRNSLDGLVMLPRCVQRTSMCALDGQAAGKQTMPGSVRQSTPRLRPTPTMLGDNAEGGMERKRSNLRLCVIPS
jgi:hypothetical protein